jgi:hypothetical protein
MRILFIILLLLVQIIPIQAQSKLNGKVQDRNSKPIAYANILLLNEQDSSLVRGALSDDAGSYIIENVYPGTYLLAASMLGYKKAYISSVKVPDLSTGIGVSVLTLTEDAELLGEVSVVAMRPLIEKQQDRMIINVANSLVASGSTGLEVLEKAPGVVVDRQSNAITLLGKEGVIVQIDGKQTYLSMADVVALLQNTPSDNIDKIELITNPSARYDAAGNAGIINIKLKENNAVGTNGSLSLAGGYGRYDRERGSMQLNHRSGNFNAFGNYSLNRGGSYSEFRLYRNQADGEQRNVIQQHMLVRDRFTGQNAKVGVDYFLGQNTTVGIGWTGFWNNRPQKSPEAGTLFRREEAGPVYLQTLSDIRISTNLSNQVGNLNLQHTFGAEGGSLSADVDLGRFSRKMNSNILAETIIPHDPANATQGLVTSMPTTIDIFTYKVDYTRTLWDAWNMEAGVKHSSVQSDNNLSLLSGFDGELLYDSTLSNHFNYKEKINAVYASISGAPFLNTEIQIGLRAEHTYSKAHSLTLDHKKVRDYLNFFPNLFVSRQLSEKHRLSFSYSYRIDRPNYQSLNPSRWYLDQYSFAQGNPFLKPQYTHAMELQHGYGDWLFTSFGTSFVSDYVFSLVLPVDHEQAELTPFNIGTLQSYNLHISFPITLTKHWKMQASLLGLYSYLQYSFQDVPLKVEQVSGRLNLSNSFMIANSWRGELSGWVNTPAVYAMFDVPWLGSVDAGIQKTFNENWNAKLSLQDILHSNKIIRDGKGPGFSQYHTIQLDTRVLMLNLTYAFGNQKLKASRQRKTASEEEMKRAN